MKKFVCTICGFVYEEAKGIPEAGISPGTKWEEVPEDWKCPLCGAAKSDFKEQEPPVVKAKPVVPAEEGETLRELSAAELSALCSNLAKGCEKQYLGTESQLFLKLAEYYKSKTPVLPEESFTDLIARVHKDLEEAYPSAHDAADLDADRGAKRALVWSEKVTRMLNSLLTRYEKEGDAMLENTNVYVCEICGFIYVGEEPPEICPVCKVPRFKIAQVKRG